MGDIDEELRVHDVVVSVRATLDVPLLSGYLLASQDSLEPNVIVRVEDPSVGSTELF